MERAGQYVSREGEKTYGDQPSWSAGGVPPNGAEQWRPPVRTPGVALRRTVTSAASPAGDRVVLSETARVLSRAAGEEAPQLHLSPAELRAMIAPESATSEDSHGR